MKAATPVLVAAPSKMSDEHFRLHMNSRHGQDIGEHNFTFDVAQPYRALHRRAHRLEEFDHVHSPEPPEAAIAFALSCLLENHLWGWREIAGAKGVVAAFPEGSFAVRFGPAKGRARTAHFDNAAEAAVVLLKGKL